MDLADLCSFKANPDNIELIEDQLFLFFRDLTLPNDATQLHKFVKKLSKSSHFTSRTLNSLDIFKLKLNLQTLKVSRFEDIDLGNEALLTREFSSIMRLKKQAMFTDLFRKRFMQYRVDSLKENLDAVGDSPNQTIREKILTMQSGKIVLK